MKEKTNNSLDEIRKCMDSSRVIVLAGHVGPDGDAVGSVLALAMSLKAYGKEVTVLLENYGDKYEMIPGKQLIQLTDDKDLTPELFLALDCADENRLGSALDVCQRAAKSICIDHHISNTYFGDMNYIDAEASSTSEIVFQLLDNWLPLNKEIATALYAGILFDTGGFRHTSVRPNTFLVASELLKYQINASFLYQELFYSRKYTQAKVLAKAINSSKVLYDGRVIISHLALSEIIDCGSSITELDEIVGYLKSIKNTWISAFLYEKADCTIKVSLRSEDVFDVCDLAAAFGGGGHVKAAGCTIHSTLEEAESKLLSEIEKRLGV